MEKKTPRPYTQESFVFAARKYLERFPCSEAKFVQTMTRKFMNRRQPVEQEWINAALKMGREIGMLNDEQYGQAVFDGYVRQGLPAMRIRQKLMLKQLAKPQISELMQTLPQDSDARREAVMIYARRKRFGPYARAVDERDYARLRRAGFDHDVVQWLLNEHDPAA